MRALLPSLAFLVLAGCASFDAAAAKPVADARAVIDKAKPVLALCPYIPEPSAVAKCADLAEAVARLEAAADVLVPAAKE